MRRRTFLTASAAVLALPGAVRAEKQRVLKFIPTGDLAVLDPIWTTQYLTHNHSYMVFDTLYGQSGYQDGFKATLQMLAGHTVEDDGKTWRLTLRDGLIFHDGEKVLACDCVASVKRWGARDVYGQALMVRTEEISATDDKTIVFRLKRPFALLPDALGHGGPNMCAIMPQRLAETDPFKQITEVVGSGPFRFKADERAQGSRFVYERFEGYKPREDGEASFTSGPKVGIWTGSSGMCCRISRPRSRRCRRARWTGWSMSPPTCCPYCARRISPPLSLAAAGVLRDICSQTIYIRHSTNHRCAAH